MKDALILWFGLSNSRLTLSYLIMLKFTQSALDISMESSGSTSLTHVEAQTTHFAPQKGPILHHQGEGAHETKKAQHLYFA